MIKKLMNMNPLLPNSWWHAVKLGAGHGLDLILPPRCLACSELVQAQGRICTPCWNQLPFTGGAHCRMCAFQLDGTGSDDAICDRCAVEPPPWQRAIAALRYEGLARTLILRFKHGDRIEAVRLLSEWLAFAIGQISTSDSLILPVPIHRWRMLARGYNQAALLAGPAAAKLGLAYQPHNLRRLISSASQQRLSAADRKINVSADHFALARAGAVHGRHVILVDDVLTTGSTLGACTTILQRAGAARVDIAVLARVAHGQSDAI